MKHNKLILSLLTLLIFGTVSSCSTDVNTNIENTEEDKNTIEYSKSPSYHHTITHIYHFNYDGHEYIEFALGFGDQRTISVVHNPDCPCKEKQETTPEQNI